LFIDFSGATGYTLFAESEELSMAKKKRKKRVKAKKKVVRKAAKKKTKARKKTKRKAAPKKKAGAKKKVSKRKAAPKKKARAKKKVTKRKAAAKKKAVRKTPKKAKARKPVKRIAKKATPRRSARRTARASSATQMSRALKRPIPRMETKPKRRALPVKDIARMTRPGDIEQIISQISDATEEISAARRTKFDIGVKHNGMAFPEQEIPSEYGKDSVVLLVVDPSFVFTYWEVRNETFQEANRQIGSDGKLTLRFYDVGTSNTPEQSNFWDVEVFDRMGNWYLKLAHPEQNLCLDIGVKNSEGHFYRIARSNLVKLPQQALAKPGPIKWMVVTPSGEKAVSDVEDYTDADLALLKKILGPYFFDLLMRGRLASITGSSVEAIFYNVENLKQGASPEGTSPWATAR
jgi:hypothetical protein